MFYDLYDWTLKHSLDIYTYCNISVCYAENVFKYLSNVLQQCTACSFVT